MKEEPPVAVGGKMKLKHFLLLAVAACLVGFVVFCLIPDEPSDLSKEEEPFKSMVLPLKKVDVISGEDLGIYMEVIDHSDARHRVRFEYDDDGITTGYPTASQGWDPYLKGPPLKDPSRARKIVIWLLKDFGDKNSPKVEVVLRRLSPRPAQDMWNHTWWRLTRFSK